LPENVVKLNLVLLIPPRFQDVRTKEETYRVSSFAVSRVGPNTQEASRLHRSLVNFSLLSHGYSFFVDWGFWIGVAGTALGAIGVIYGVWARSHPGSGRLAYRVTESALIPQNSDVERLRVLLDDREITNPWLAVVEIVNVGGIDLAPAAFEGGYLRLSTSGSTEHGRGAIEGVLSPVDGALKIVEWPGGSFVDPDLVESAFELSPQQLKARNSISITLLAGYRALRLARRPLRFDPKSYVAQQA